MFKENQTFDGNDVQTNKVIAALSVVPILFWLVFINKPASNFVKHLANHGLWYLIISVGLGIINSILVVLTAVIPILPALLIAIITLASLGITALIIVEIVQAASGKAYDIFFIDTYKLIK